MFTKRLDQLEQDAGNLRRHVRQTLAHARLALAYGVWSTTQLNAYFEQALNTTRSKALHFINAQPVETTGDWNDTRWKTWEPAFSTDSPPAIRIGWLVEQPHPLAAKRFILPAYAPFIGQNRTVVVQAGPDSSEIERSLAIIQALLARSAALLPWCARYTLFVPDDDLFPLAAQLPAIQLVRQNRLLELHRLMREVHRRQDAYPNTPFDQLPAAVRFHEKYHLVFAAGLPQGYDYESLTLLLQLAEQGPAVGMYLFLQEQGNARRTISDDIANSAIITPRAGFVPVQGCTFKPDAVPADDVLTMLAAPPRVVWPDTAYPAGIRLPRVAAWWEESAAAGVRVPVGTGWNGTPIHVGFETGTSAPGAHCQVSGAGRMRIAHALILGAATRYSPLDVRFYLVGHPGQADFDSYRTLPHAECVCLNPTPAMVQALVSDLITEQARRLEYFEQQGVADFQAYRQAKGTIMPRLLVIIADLQTLLETDYDGQSSEKLRQLILQGDRTGMHLVMLLLQPDPTQLLHYLDVLPHIHQQIGTQLSPSAVDHALAFGIQGKRLLRQCDTPEKFVVDYINRDGQQSPAAGYSMVLDGDAIAEIVQQLADRAHAEIASLPVTRVLSGPAQSASPVASTPDNLSAFLREWFDLIDQAEQQATHHQQIVTEHLNRALHQAHEVKGSTQHLAEVAKTRINRLAALTDSLSAAQQRITRLLANSVKLLQTAEADHTQWAQDEALARRGLVGVQKNLVMLSSLLDKASGVLVQRQTTLKQANQSFRAARQARNQARANWQTARQAITVLKQEFQATRRDLKTANQALGVRRAALDQGKDELRRANDEIRSAKQRLAETRAKLERARIQLRAANNDLTTARNHFQTKRGAFFALVSRRNAMRRGSSRKSVTYQVQSAKRERDLTKATFLARKTVHTEKKRIFQQELAAHQTSRSRLEQARRRHTAAKSDLEYERAEFHGSPEKRRVIALKARLDEIPNEIAQHQRFRQDLNQAQQHFLNMKAQREAAQVTHDEARQRVLELKHHHQAAREALLRAHMLLRASRQALRATDQTLSMARQAVVRANASLSTVKREHEYLQAHDELAQILAGALGERDYRVEVLAADLKSIAAHVQVAAADHANARRARQQARQQAHFAGGG